MEEGAVCLDSVVEACLGVQLLLEDSRLEEHLLVKVYYLGVHHLLEEFLAQQLLLVEFLDQQLLAVEYLAQLLLLEETLAQQVEALLVLQEEEALSVPHKTKDRLCLEQANLLLVKLRLNKLPHLEVHQEDLEATKIRYLS